MSNEEKKQLQKLLIGYKGMNNALISKLHKLGLNVTETSNHIKITSVNGSGVVYLSKSPSDHRTGQNAIVYLKRLLNA